MSDVGIQAYLMQVLRKQYTSLIDAWHYAGRPEQAAECAEQAVQQGVWTHPMQRARDHFPGLSVAPIHDPAQFWFIGLLEENYRPIRDELERVLRASHDPLRPTAEERALIRRGEWEQAHLFRAGMRQDDICALFPVTADIVARIPDITTLGPGLVSYSRLTPGTHITPHCGPTNAVLRVHFPIIVPPGPSLRVADREMRWEEGKCLVFDDAFEHEVWHRGTEDRIVLILDVFHPELDSERRERLLTQRRSFEEQAAEFVRELRIDRVEARGQELVMYPDPGLRGELQRYLNLAGATGAESHGDGVVWRRADPNTVAKEPIS
ncbi:aspartyl/asparaginyl beta-hydroxylase domain-containing protein [Nocardia sp. NPDC047038]|uniref:aspartyl/asparaginyl beta-hydroxylase domain-containing protein n=1 Tax=Nocardia sp. NPDC047038 TaxID=3154338 RepID=UPI0033E6407B